MDPNEIVRADKIGQAFFPYLVSFQVGQRCGLGCTADGYGNKLPENHVRLIIMPWDDLDIGFEYDVDEYDGLEYCAFIGKSGDDWSVYTDYRYAHLGTFPSREEAYDAAREYVYGNPQKPDAIGIEEVDPHDLGIVQEQCDAQEPECFG